MSPGHPIARQMARDLSTLYKAWNTAEPGKGHDAKAGEWEARTKRPDAVKSDAPKSDAPKPDGASPQAP
jgi:hypothetical protein